MHIPMDIGWKSPVITFFVCSYLELCNKSEYQRSCSRHAQPKDANTQNQDEYNVPVDDCVCPESEDLYQRRDMSSHNRREMYKWTSSSGPDGHRNPAKQDRAIDRRTNGTGSEHRFPNNPFRWCLHVKNVIHALFIVIHCHSLSFITLVMT